MGFSAAVLLVAVLLAGAPFLPSFFHPDVPVGRASERLAVLGDPAYQYDAVLSPVATGRMLSLQSWLLTSTHFGPFVRRFLLNQNKFHVLRDLASQAADLAPLYYPMRRLSSDAYEVHVAHSRGDLSADSLLDGSSTAHPLRDSNSQIMQLHAAYHARDSSPLDVARKVIEAIKIHNPTYRMFDAFDERDILEQAQLSQKRWSLKQPLSVLDGIPVGVKNMVKVKGYVMTDGSAHHQDGKPSTVDDHLVARLRNLGAIIVGVTSMTEGGTTPLGYSVASKGPFNPHNTSYYPGGSSSGSAVAVALGITPFSVGFDGGGSVRIPASMSGVTGLATSFARVPFTAHQGGTNLKAGPLASTVADAAIAFAAMASNPSSNDHYFDKLYDGGVRGVPPVHAHGMKSKDLAGKRVGIFSAWFNDADANVLGPCRKAVQGLRDRGAEIVEISIPNIQWLRLAHAAKISSEFALGWDAIHHAEKPLMEPNTRITVGLGSSFTALEVISAERLRRFAFEHVVQLFSNHSLSGILTPTLPTLPPILKEDAKLLGESNVPLVVNTMKFIFLANFLGLPAISIPIASHDGLPIGFQVIGQHWGENEILTLASAVESAVGDRPKPMHFSDLLS